MNSLSDDFRSYILNYRFSIFIFLRLILFLCSSCAWIILFYFLALSLFFSHTYTHTVSPSLFSHSIWFSTKQQTNERKYYYYFFLYFGGDNYHFELPFLDGHYYTKQIKKKITASYFPRPFVSEIFCSMLFRPICYTQQKWEWANPKRSSRPTCYRIRFFFSLSFWQCMGARW